MAEFIFKNSEPGPEMTLLSPSIANSQSVVNNPGAVKEDRYLAEFETALLKVQEKNYDQNLILKLIETNAQLISHELTKKIMGLEASNVLLQRELLVYQYLYGKGNIDTSDRESMNGERQTGGSYLFKIKKKCKLF